MRPRSFAALGLLLLGCAAGAHALAPGSPPHPSAPATPPSATQPIVTINGVRDTGQYLPDTTVLGRVDGRVFRIGEFVDRWFASYFLDRPRADSAGRYEFLNSMVNKEVLADLARRVNRPLGFEDRAALRETRERLLSNATFARLVSDSAHYTNDEVRHLYQQGQYELHLQRIVSADPGSAERARAEVIGKHLPWTEVAQRYSLFPDADGDLGWVRRDSIGPAAALDIFDLPDGGISQIHRDGDGWWFAQVLGRRPHVQPPLSQVGKMLAQEILGVKLNTRTEVLRQQVRREIGMVYDSTNIAWATAVFAERERQTRGTSKLPVIDMSSEAPQFEPADTSRRLARWKDGTLTLGDFLAEYNATPVIGRDKITNFAAFRGVLDGYILEPYMAELAVRRGLDRDPIVTEGMAKKEEQIRVEHLFGDSIEARLWVSNEERRQYYEAHLPDFMSLQSVTYAAIARSSRAGADSVVARLKAGERATDVLRADSLSGLASGSIKVEGERDGSEMHLLVFNEMREGDVHVLGPDKEGYYLVLQKLVHDAGHQLSLDQVMTLVDESVQNLKAERMLKEFIARHREGHVIELHPERLMRVKLVDPSI